MRLEWEEGAHDDHRLAASELKLTIRSSSLAEAVRALVREAEERCPCGVRKTRPAEFAHPTDGGGAWTRKWRSHRPHRSLDLTPPNPAPPTLQLVAASRSADVLRRDRLGGLIHEYRLAA